MINALPWLSGIFIEFSPAVANTNAPSPPADSVKSPDISTVPLISKLAASCNPVESVITPSVITVLPIVKSVLASIVVPVIGLPLSCTVHERL